MKSTNRKHSNCALVMISIGAFTTCINAGTVVFNTSSGSITVTDGSSETFDSPPTFIYETNTNGESVFSFSGNLVISNDTLIFTGSRPAGIKSSGNLTIRDSIIQASATNTAPGPGGGSGGNGGIEGFRTSAISDPVSGGNGSTNVSSSGSNGFSGITGGAGRTGSEGRTGTAGRNSEGEAAGGSPGSGGAGGTGPSGGRGGSSATSNLRNGSDGAPGTTGRVGASGRSGNNGASGVNTGTGPVPSGGNGGGGGGGGGSGGEGSSGSSGGGGGAGRGNSSSQSIAGGKGQTAGQGGNGGEGGRGGDGGEGGGAITIECSNLLTLENTAIHARGGNGKSGSGGGSGAGGFSNIGITSGDSSTLINPDTNRSVIIRGGKGGISGRGGRGGAGGRGGDGGGGAGGSINLISPTVEFFADVLIDTSGGVGGSSGRYILQADSVVGEPINIVGRSETYPGPANPDPTVTLRDFSIEGNSATFTFSGPPGLDDWKIMGSTDLQDFSIDKTPMSDLSEIAPGEYTAVVDVSAEPDRLFLRIER